MFGDGFQTFDVEVSGSRVHGVHHRGDGTGVPVLLLHGFPQTHAMWRRAAVELASSRPVVAADLRGYGDSGRPRSGPDHAGYSFRAMATDQVELMTALGYERFAVVGHDRGARVTHRLALDHPQRIDRLALLDILPTEYVYAHVDRALATAYYHWFLFIQPEDVPERMLGADPAYFLARFLHGWGGRSVSYEPAAYAEYERVFALPEARHAMLEDYRAGASIDLEHDAASAAAGERIVAPCLVLWGGSSVVGRNRESPLEVWERLATRPELVHGRAVEDAGHFLVEERPEAVLPVLRGFLG